MGVEWSLIKEVDDFDDTVLCGFALGEFVWCVPYVWFVIVVLMLMMMHLCFSALLWGGLLFVGVLLYRFFTSLKFLQIPCLHVPLKLFPSSSFKGGFSSWYQL